jgi:hypothetical protein
MADQKRTEPVPAMMAVCVPILARRCGDEDLDGFICALISCAVRLKWLFGLNDPTGVASLNELHAAGNSLVPAQSVVSAIDQVGRVQRALDNFRNLAFPHQLDNSRALNEDLWRLREDVANGALFAALTRKLGLATNPPPEARNKMVVPVFQPSAITRS